MSVLGLIRGVDYIFQGSGATPESLNIIENVLAITAWGWIFTISGVLAIIGGTWSFYRPSITASLLTLTGHIGLSAVYTTVGFGTLEAVHASTAGFDPFNDPVVAALSLMLVGVGVHPVFVSDVALGLGAAKGVRKIEEQ